MGASFRAIQILHLILEGLFAVSGGNFVNFSLSSLYMQDILKLN